MSEMAQDIVVGDKLTEPDLLSTEGMLWASSRIRILSSAEKVTGSWECRARSNTYWYGRNIISADSAI